MTTELRLQVNLPASSTTYLDLAAILSAANHRLYRQSYLYKAEFRIDGDAAVGLGTDEQFVVEVLPTTWPMMKALKQAKETAMEALTPERKSQVARWNDFRMYYDTTHKAQSFVQLPLGCSIVYGTDAEYAYTQVFDDVNQAYTFHALGGSTITGSNRTFGALDQYDKSGDTGSDNAPPGNNYGNVLNDVNDANLDELSLNGDLPPYNKDNLQVPTKSFNLFALGATVQNVGYSVRTTGLLDVPHGLVKVTNNVNGARQLIIRFKAGKYKGVHAEAM